MDLDLNPDQALLAETLEKWAAGHRDIAADERTRPFLDGGALADELQDQGFLDVCRVPELGVLGGVLLIDVAGRLPRAVELAGSGLVAPALGLPEAPRPMALLRKGGRAVQRFLAPGGAALVDCGDHVRLLDCAERAEPVDSPYAYPMGRYRGDPADDAVPLDGVAVEHFRRLRTIAFVAEAMAAMEAALALTVEHVTMREQFKRPIGSFQAVQHRLAECSAAASAVRWLLYRAASDEEARVGDAAIVAHDAAKRVIYETTQFHGALGLTLEYPLHLWTYRLRALQIELAQAAAEASQ